MSYDHKSKFKCKTNLVVIKTFLENTAADMFQKRKIDLFFMKILYSQLIRRPELTFTDEDFRTWSSYTR